MTDTSKAGGRCPNDLGFDREQGPLGCSLEMQGAPCECAAVYASRSVDTSKPAVAAVVERLGTRAGIGSAIDATHPRSHLVYALIDEAASLISALEAERDEARKLANQYAWERDKAREERDVAEYRSAAFWKPLNAKTVARAEAAEALNATLQARLGKAAEALEPFAAIAEEGVLANDLDETVVSVSTENLLDLTLVVRDFRRARSTLSTLRETTDDQT